MPHLLQRFLLTHLTTLIANYRITLDSQEVGQYFKWAKQYYARVESDPKFAKVAGDHMEILELEREKNTVTKGKGKTTRRVGKKTQKLQQFNEFDRQEKVLNLVKSVEVACGRQNPTVTFQTVITLKNKASKIWEQTNNIEKYLAAQKRTYLKLLELETDIAQILSIGTEASLRSPDEYKRIYSELARVVTLKAAKPRFPEFVTVSQNCAEIESSLLRLAACAEVLGGSTNDFESIPNSLKHIYAILKYFQGEPEYWDQYKEKLELHEQKKREARKKKKSRNAAKIKSHLQQQEDLKQIQEEKKRAQAEEQAKLKAQRTLSLQDSLTKSSPSSTQSPDTNRVDIQRPVNETAAIKKQAREKLRREEERAAKKEERTPSIGEVPDSKSAVAPKTSIEEKKPTEYVSVKALLSGADLKLYQSLYGSSPKLTSAEALKLLGACGLTINEKEGKGSHTKGTLIAGETIKDSNGKIIWTCPELGSDSMMIIPKWDGHNIPFYMVKNLKYLLEKIGIRPQSL